MSFQVYYIGTTFIFDIKYCKVIYEIYLSINSPNKNKMQDMHHNIYLQF